MKSHRPIIATILLFAVSAVGLPEEKADQAAKDELAKLQGKWKVVSLIKSGEAVNDIAKLELVFLFKDQSLTVTADAAPNFTPQQRVLRLVANATPKLLDFADSDKAFAERQGVFEGIYLLDGDALQRCFRLEGDKPANANRPAAVESKEGSGVVLIKLERVKN